MLTSVEFFKELSTFNFVTFYDKKHIYKFRDMPSVYPRSATSIIGNYKNVFDSEYQSMKVAQKRGVPQAQVLAEWAAASKESTDKGTLFHKYAEDYINNRVFPNNTAKVLKKQFKSFYRQYVETGRLIPIVSEFVIGDKDLALAGMIDQLFLDPKTGTLHIFDWKTNKRIRRKSDFHAFFKAPISSLEECEYNIYSLQLSIYKYIFTRNTSLVFGDSFIVWFNENNADFELIKCVDLEKEAKMVIGVRSL